MVVRTGALIREARRSAQLSQTDVARRAGIAQSVVSAYESGKREPSVQTLAKLVEATGHQLTFTLTPAPKRRLGLPNTRLGRKLRYRRKAINDIADRRGAHNVRVFGSVARGEDTGTSDVDFLVDLDDRVGLIQLAGLRRELAELLDVDVDVIPSTALKPRFRDRVLAEAITL